MSEAQQPQPQEDAKGGSFLTGLFTGDYGMLAVLLAIVLLFSLLTIERRAPSDSGKAGRLLAERIHELAPGAKVFIAGSDTEGDREFGRALAEALEESGESVVGTSHGAPPEIKQAIRGATGVEVVAPSPAIETLQVFDEFESGPVKKITTPKRAWPDLLKIGNLRNIASQIAIIAIIAIGMTMVIITAGIDLSVGSLVALSAVTTTYFIQKMGGADGAGFGSLVIASVIAIVACAAAGAFTGWMVVGFCVPPFIATLAMMQMLRGLGYEISDNGTLADVPASYQWLGNGLSFGVPNCVILMLLLYAIAHVMMAKTKLGRHIYATGGNPEAARLSGVSPKRIKLIVYMISGGLAGLGGVVLASQLQAGAGSYGLGYELKVIAAVVVGGTSLFGGRGRIFGTLIGAFIIAVIENGMNLKGLGDEKQMIVLGAVILVAVLIERVRSGEWRSAVGG